MTNESKVLLGLGVLTVVLLVGAALVFGRSSSGNNPSPTPDSQVLVREDSNKIATESAQITIVEFGDYQCPACRDVYSVIKQILKDYEGKINFVFRNYPLPQHTNAQISAEAAEAGGAQGKFWEMHDKLYENQSVWSESDKPLDIFTSYAKDLGLDTNKFQEDVKTNKFATKIQEDTADGNLLGISATPTIYINGQKLPGVPTYDELKKIIELDFVK